jgi:predicted transcriptional regulator
MHTDVADWLRLVHTEYHEMPGLNLTKSQVQRLWGLDQVTCDEVLHALEAEHFLRRTEGDQYVLVEGPE